MIDETTTKQEREKKDKNLNRKQSDKKEMKK